MVYFANGFQPQTALGASLSNLSQALFAGQVSPNEQKRLDLERQKTEAYIRGQDAQAEYDGARAAGERGLNEGRRAYGSEQLRVRFGDKGNQIRNYVTEGIGENPLSGMNPDDMQFVNALFQTGEAVRAGGGNADQIMKGAQTAQDMGIKEAFLKGRVSPTQFAVTEGKPVVQYEDGVRYNQYDLGIPQVTDALFSANVGAKNASAAKDTAQASKYRNDIRVDNQNLEINRGKSNREKLVGTFKGYDANGNEIYEYTEQRSGNQFVKPAKKGGTGGISYTPKSPADIDATVLSVLGVDELPEGTLPLVRQEIGRLSAASGNKGFDDQMINDAVANVRQANPQAFMNDGGWFGGEFDASERVPKSPAKAAPAGGKAKPTPQAIQFYKANKAKDPTLRKQFMEKYGIDPDAGESIVPGGA
jgi:uncharacterized small protein (DUF1192 family)